MIHENSILVPVFYFSGTGNTWWAAEELSRQLNENGLPSRAYSIEALSASDASALVDSAIMVGFGYPIHGSDLPEPMKIFIATLSAVKEKPAFTFCTQWLWSGDGAAIGASLVRNIGFDVRWGEHFLMPNNVTVTIIRLPYTNNPDRLSKALNRTRRKIEKFASKIITGKPYRHGFNRFSFLMGCLQRIPYRRFYHRLQDHIAVNPDSCIDCGLCVRLCPSGNLFFNGEEYLTRGSCTLCLRCYNFCPKAAINFMKRPHLAKRGKPYRGPIDNFNPEALIKTDFQKHRSGIS